MSQDKADENKANNNQADTDDKKQDSPGMQAHDKLAKKSIAGQEDFERDETADDKDERHSG